MTNEEEMYAIGRVDGQAQGIQGGLQQGYAEGARAAQKHISELQARIAELEAQVAALLKRLAAAEKALGHLDEYYQVAPLAQWEAWEADVAAYRAACGEG